VPDKINFKSLIRNASGQALSNQIVELRLSIVDQSSNPAETIVEQIETQQTSSSGIVCVELVTDISIDGTDIRWWEGDLWFRLEVDTDGSGVFDIVEDAKMRPVPYAHFAEYTTGTSDHPMGPTGPTGPDGLAGPTGAQGPKGPTGSPGADGVTGPPGLASAAGPTGPTGPMNPVSGIGPTGPAGANGANGPQGPTGPPGSQGANGSFMQPCPGPNGADGPPDPFWETTANNVHLADLTGKMILSAPNGSCWELKIIGGSISTEAVTCP